MKGRRPIHIISNNLKEIENMRGSKYIQSNYSKIVDKIANLSKNKKILFVGIPCQIYGLKNLLKLKKCNLDNILFVDLICHGIPSYLIFDKYLDPLNIKDKFTINFRDKSSGWENFSMSVKSENNKYCFSVKEDKFMQFFLSNLGLRNSCYNCKFSCSSQADITLGDFWAVPNKIKNEKGTSAIIVHSLKGENLIKYLEKSGKITLNKTTFFYISKGNPKILDGITKKPKNRRKFLDSLRTNNFDKTYNKFVRPNFYKKVKNFAYFLLKKFTP